MACSAAVAACGGSSTGQPQGNVTVTAVQISGTGAKGIIKNAIVTAYELAASGATLRTVGTAVTDASGKYSMETNSSYGGGPLKLELTAKGDGSTKMVCDVAAGCGTGVAFGQDYTLSSSFKLGAYQQGSSGGGAVTTQITPYSNMVVARVEAQVNAGSQLNNTLVAGAVSQVNQIVGVDISTTEPVDITSALAVSAAGADALQYAAFNAGIGGVAFASGNFETGVANAASSFSDGKFDNSDTVKITDITAAVASEVTAMATLDSTTLTAQLASIATNTTGGTFSPVASQAATLTAIAQARALVTQTRTWGTQLAALQNPADAFGVDVNTAGAVLNSNSGVLGGVFAEMIRKSFDVLAVKAHSPTGLATGSYPINGYYWNGTALVLVNGNVVVSTSNGYLTWTISGTNAGVTTSGTVTSTIPSSVLGQPSTNLNLATSTTMTVNGSATMSSPAASITISNAVISLALKAAGNTGTMTNSNIDSLSFNGGLAMQAGGVSFSGTGKYVMVSNSAAVDQLSISEIALSGTFTGSKGSANTSASIKFNNAATFDTIGFLNHRPYVWVNKWVPGDALGVAAKYAATHGGATLQWGHYDSYSDQTCGYETVSNPNPCTTGDVFGLVDAVTADIVANYTNPAPIAIQNVYAFYNVNSGSQYSAMLVYPDFETASNYANATVTVSYNVTLTGSPAATLTVTANRTGFSNARPTMGDAVAILTFSGQSVKFEANNTNPTTAGTLTITNPDGVKMVIGGAANSNTGTVSVDGTAVGTIDQSGATTLIHYNDGTFESLN